MFLISYTTESGMRQRTSSRKATVGRVSATTASERRGQTMVADAGRELGKDHRFHKQLKKLKITDFQKSERN